jgi:pyruvate-formate lyase-activating enzyme
MPRYLFFVFRVYTIRPKIFVTQVTDCNMMCLYCYTVSYSFYQILPTELRKFAVKNKNFPREPEVLKTHNLQRDRTSLKRVIPVSLSAQGVAALRRHL